MSAAAGPGSYEAIDLFSGIGWDIALRQLGHEALGLDYDRNVAKIRRAHGFDTLLVDLHAFDPWQVSIPSVRGLIGSPSCKKWSPAGKQEASSELSRILAAVPGVAKGASAKRNKRMIRDVLPDVDPEAALVLAPLAWAAHHRPEWIALEQVPQVQPVWDAIAIELELMGYSVDTGVLHSEQFGVPQTRRRSVLVANSRVRVHLPQPTHSKYHAHNPTKLDGGVKPWISMADALDWAVGNAPAMRSNYGTGGNPADRGLRDNILPAPTVTTKIGRNKWVRPAWPGVRPSPTIVGTFRPDIVAAPGYRKAGDGPRQNAPDSVAVTIEEAATLQSFPADIDWHVVPKSAREAIVGNAIPVLLAKQVIQAARGDL